MIIDVPKYFTRKNFRLTGIYFMIRKRKIVYIGKTTNLIIRLAQSEHVNRRYDYLRFIQCDEVSLERYERRWIKKFKPKMNKVGVIITNGCNKGLLVMN